MNDTDIKAVELVRRIRERHGEVLKGKSPEERIAFYREKARGLLEEAEERKKRGKKSA